MYVLAQVSGRGLVWWRVDGAGFTGVRVTGLVEATENPNHRTFGSNECTSYNKGP